MATPITGDQASFTAKQKYGVTLHNFPQVLSTDLLDATATINEPAQSGKRLGAQVMAVDSFETVAVAGVYIATGTSPEDPWVLSSVVLGAPAALVTPV